MILTVKTIDDVFCEVVSTEAIPFRFQSKGLLRVLRNYPRLELHTFHRKEDAQANPFIEEIEKAGIEIDLR